MKKIAYFIVFIISLVLTSCGASKGNFKIEGKFLHMNQGEFYVYSTDGAIQGMDTIKVEGGRFAYEIPCQEEGTLMLVFPNFSEVPIFVESGGSIDIKADASHLKELQVKGTDANEDMTDVRMQLNKVSPPEERQVAETFIKENPGSIVSTYLVRKYFIQGYQPDYKKALSLINLMLKEQDKNGQLQRLKQQTENLAASAIGNSIPTFSAKDINGQPVSNNTLTNSPFAVIYVWSNWNYESQQMQRDLKNLQRKSAGKLALLGICAEGNQQDCKNTMKRDSIKAPTICDGMMLECNTIKKLGLTAVPDNLVLQNGRIIARSLNPRELQDKLNSLLK